jgi:pimeloyl-ACP methyl ester carboxylesterase
MALLRTRFDDIVCEFMPSESKDVLIWAGGMPGYPWRSRNLAWLSKHYWVFFPRYRGTWESGGKFLAKSPEKDIIDIIDMLPRGFKDLWSGTQHKLKPRHIFIVGASFGGPAAILASRDKRVKKVLCLSPVVDWTASSEDEPMDKLGVFLREGFGEGYRFSDNDWKKLRRGIIYQPVNHIEELDGRKITIIHCKDDKSVPYSTVEQFAKDTGSRLIAFNKGGHGGSAKWMRPWWFWRVKKHLNC